MLWVALYCPTLPLDRAQRRLPDALALPLAVCEAHGSKRWIGVANQSAQQHGVAAGQPVATALALCPAVMLLERDSADEHRAISEAALASLRFTPSVHVLAEGLLLEVHGSVRLFGGRRTLLHQIQQSFYDLGLAPAIGVAPTAHGAWLLARSLQPKQTKAAPSSQLIEQLDALPVALLDASADHLVTLKGIGCRRLGDLRRLPRAGLARRFGQALIDELDRAYVICNESFCWFEAPLQFRSRLELIARVETTEALIFAMKHLMAQLSGWLSARQAAVGCLTIDLHHERWRPTDQRQTTLVIALSQPSKDPQHLMGLIRERLGQLVLNSPVEEMSLAADQVVLADDANQELFPTVQSTAVSLNQLIEKLVARLGAEAVSRIHSRSDHRPEKAWASCQAKAEPCRPEPIVATARPSWIMQQPEALAMQGHRPVYGSSLALLCGPERIEAGWWDDAAVARDYFIAENLTGQLLWIYRQRHATDGSSNWYLQGLFA